MSEVDEIDINPFFKVLQTKFCSVYEQAQEDCNLICIPQSDCLQGVYITHKFVMTHILKPSPFFKGQFMTLLSDSQTVSISDEGHYLCMEEGFPTKARVKIVNEELGYNKGYKPYKMLIIERPLDLNVVRKSSSNMTKPGEFKLEFTFKACRDFLYSFPELSKHIKDLDGDIGKFNNNYILLRDFLHDASERLCDISSSAAEKCFSGIQNKQFNKQKNKDFISTAVEIYLLASVHQKLYSMICSKFSVDDGVMVEKCCKLQGLTPDQLHVPQQFSCPLPTAVVELAHLDGLQTPIEKLYCLKTTFDSITEEINTSIQESQIQGMPVDEVACLTSDDLIPIIVTVIVQAKCGHLHSDMFYMENFYWSTETRDRDNLSYCLVTFKAAVQYMMTTNFDDVDFSKNVTRNEISILELMDSQKMERKSPSVEEPSASVTETSRRRSYSRSRYDQQMENITKMLEENMTDTGKSKTKVENPAPSSIFPTSFPKHQQTPDLVPDNDARKKKEQLGDFLSSLQDDMFSSCGKQS